MDEVGLEASVCTDAGNERLCLDSDISLFHSHALVWRRPGLGREGVEGEDRLIHKDYLHLVELGQLDQIVHLLKHRLRLGVGVVENLLAFLDVLELDAMLLVKSLEMRCTNRKLRKVSMEHHCTLFEREVGPGHQGIRMQ